MAGIKCTCTKLAPKQSLVLLILLTQWTEDPTLSKYSYQESPRAPSAILFVVNLPVWGLRNRGIRPCTQRSSTSGTTRRRCKCDDRAQEMWLHSKALGNQHRIVAVQTHDKKQKGS